MRAFSDWMHEQRVAKQEAAQPAEDKLLPEGVWLNRDGKPVAACSGCGNSYEIEDVTDFSNDVSYCGGSPRCLP